LCGELDRSPHLLAALSAPASSHELCVGLRARDQAHGGTITWLRRHPVERAFSCSHRVIVSFGGSAQVLCVDFYASMPHASLSGSFTRWG
jgi:hypothetical protein